MVGVHSVFVSTDGVSTNVEHNPFTFVLAFLFQPETMVINNKESYHIKEAMYAYKMALEFPGTENQSPSNNTIYMSCICTKHTSSTLVNTPVHASLLWKGLRGWLQRGDALRYCSVRTLLLRLAILVNMPTRLVVSGSGRPSTKII